MLYKIYVLTICAIFYAHGQSLQLDPFRAVFNMPEGSTLEVRCLSSSSAEWTADPSSAMPVNAVKGQTPGGNGSIFTLKLINISKANEGTFRCTSDKKEQVSFQLKVFSVVTQNATFEYKVDTTLQCQVQDAPSAVIYSWKKGNLNVSDLPREGKQAFKDHGNGTLEIIHPARSFAGEYTCVAEFQDGTILEEKVPYYATPKVLPFEKSKNLVEGEELVIVCQVLGYPKPIVSWRKGNTILGGGDSDAKLESADAYDGKPVDNAKLIIKEVGFADAGEYRCFARNRQWPNFNSSQPILVRVKDKLAALWPFLGIVAEVAILCTIIFIYEKKRNKDAVMDEEDEQPGNAEAKHAENVRHRGNTNPRA